jgi:hypothetical protein
VNTIPEKHARLELMPGLFRQQTDAGVRLTMRWFASVGKLPTKFFEILLLLGGLAIFVPSLISLTRLFTGKGAFFEILTAIFFFLIGFFLAYRGLALLFNQSTFFITRTQCSVRHNPIPYPGAASLNLSIADVASVEWQKVGHVSQTGNINGHVSSGYSASFDVVLTTKSGKTYTLLSAIRAREYAFAIASELTNLLER